MLPIAHSDDWRRAYPGACIGLLELSEVDNTRASPELENAKRALEADLATKFGGFKRHDFLQIPILAAYKTYYRKFNKTYHVQLQIESLAIHHKSLPDVSPLVDANFMAEMETFVLTAGHDVTKLHPPIVMDIAGQEETMDQMGGARKVIPERDMVMRDAEAICCSIIYGQDNRSPISAATRHVLYVAYGPAGVDPAVVNEQLVRIEDRVRTFSPLAVLEQMRVVIAD